jgi:hypothetical protein
VLSATKNYLAISAGFFVSCKTCWILFCILARNILRKIQQRCHLHEWLTIVPLRTIFWANFYPPPPRPHSDPRENVICPSPADPVALCIFENTYVPRLTWVVLEDVTGGGDLKGHRKSKNMNKDRKRKNTGKLEANN